LETHGEEPVERKIGRRADYSKTGRRGVRPADWPRERAVVQFAALSDLALKKLRKPLAFAAWGAVT
jgi:hypothetical protein